MNSVFIVQEYFNNGEWYEEEYESNTPIRAFSTRENAIQFLAEMPETKDVYEDKYVEVKKDDFDFKYVMAFGNEYVKYYIHKERERYDGNPVYATIAYSIKEIPFN